MLEDLTPDAFAPHVGEGFRLAGAVDVVLRAVDHGAPAPEGLRAPFSLRFTGPAEPVVPQGLHPLEHPALGRLELFVVPIVGTGPDGAVYEVVFG